MSDRSDDPSFAAEDREVMSFLKNYVRWTFSEGRATLSVVPSIKHVEHVVRDYLAALCRRTGMTRRCWSTSSSISRRDTTASFRKLVEGAGFTITALRHNLTGFVGCLWHFRILGPSEQSRGVSRCLDHRVLPVQLRVERASSLPPGQSVYAAARMR